MKSKDKQRKRKLPEFILSSLKWLANTQNLGYKDTTLVLGVATKILTILNTRGKTECIRYCKDLRLKFAKIVLSVDPVTFKRGDQSWLPKTLVPIISHIESLRSYPFIRLIFSALYITRILRVDGEISLSTIEKGPGYTGNPLSLDEDIYLFLKDLGVNTTTIGKVPRALRFKEFHMSSKSGPNGHALWTSYMDIMSLTPKQLDAIRATAGEKLVDLISRFSSLYKRIPLFFDSRATRKGSLVSRRLAKIQDKEGKIREVAIGDYYTQAALLPLHNYLSKTLSRIHQDCTSDQTKLFYTLENSIGSSYHSIDLKAFTDRFPIVINQRILTIWFGPEYADAWKELMIGSPYYYKGYPAYYRTGNPMGIYSSFNSTSLAHHFLVWKACRKANLRWKRARYMLLGDDIVIANDRLASEYKKLLAEWDIEIQYSKTHESPYGFEFAKQIRLHGVNVSPFPLAALYERRCETISSLAIIVQEFDYKRWNSDLMSDLGNYLVNVLGWNRTRWSKFKPTLNLVISFLKTLQGKGQLGKALYAYVKTIFPIKKIVWQKKVNQTLFVQWVTVQVVQKLYLKSRERIVSDKTKGSLGDLATEMVCHITSLRDGGMDCFDLIEAVPFLQVYGRAEEIYLKSYDSLYDYGMGTQPNKLRDLIGKVDIPLSDEGFYVRHRDVLIVQSMRASRIITEILKTTKEVSAYNGKLKFELPWSAYIKT